MTPALPGLDSQHSIFIMLEYNKNCAPLKSRRIFLAATLRGGCNLLYFVKLHWSKETPEQLPKYDQVRCALTYLACRKIFQSRNGSFVSFGDRDFQVNSKLGYP